MKMRGKLQVKRIENKNSRHVTFSKRRTGLIKKAKELSVLCDVEVAVFVFSGKGKLYQFSTANSLRKIVERCQMQNEADIACGSAQYAEKIPQRQIDIGGDTNPLQPIQRYLEDQKVEQLDVTEITQLEHKLDVILHQLKSKKSQLMMEAVSTVHEKEKQLRMGNQSAQQEVQLPAMMNEGQYQAQQSQEEFFAATDNDILYLQPFYML